jgi:hypothetical protein
MFKACIIGSSEIISHHINAMLSNNIEIHSICSTRKNSKNLIKIKKKYKKIKIYSNWQQCIEESSVIKNIFFLVAPRVDDTFKIIKFISKYKLPILTEKPVSKNLSELQYLKKFNNYIFVGYNRIFFDNINFLSKLNIKNSIISINCPEKNKITFLENSCHIISIILFIFKKITIIKKIQNKNYIFCSFKTKNSNIINLNILFKTPTNFSINIKSNSHEIMMRPIEKLLVYNSLKVKKINNLYVYKQIIKIKRTELRNKNKPGFHKQYKEFKKSIMQRKMHKTANIFFASNVMRIAKDIIK